jgi:hypothetical protein
MWRGMTVVGREGRPRPPTGTLQIPPPRRPQLLMPFSLPLQRAGPADLSPGLRVYAARECGRDCSFFVSGVIQRRPLLPRALGAPSPAPCSPQPYWRHEQGTRPPRAECGSHADALPAPTATSRRRGGTWGRDAPRRTTLRARSLDHLRARQAHPLDSSARVVGEVGSWGPLSRNRLAGVQTLTFAIPPSPPSCKTHHSQSRARVTPSRAQPRTRLHRAESLRRTQARACAARRIHLTTPQQHLTTLTSRLERDAPPLPRRRCCGRPCRGRERTPHP